MGIATASLHVQAALHLAILANRTLLLPAVNLDGYLLWTAAVGICARCMVPIEHYFDREHAEGLLASGGWQVRTCDGDGDEAAARHDRAVFVHSYGDVQLLANGSLAGQAQHVHVKVFPMSGVYRSARERALRRAVVLALLPAPRLRRVARELRQRLGSESFVCLYPRTEPDWVRVCGYFDLNADCILRLEDIAARMRSLADAGLVSRALPVFVVGASSGDASLHAMLVAAGFGRVVSKETLWPELRGERGAHERALIEGELCQDATQFVGHVLSSFSFLVGERRRYAGRPSQVYNFNASFPEYFSDAWALWQRLYLTDCVNAQGGQFKACWRELMQAKA